MAAATVSVPVAPVQVEHDGRVLCIVLRRPAKRNALTAEMCAFIVDAIDDCQKDSHVGAILLTGEGPIFCSGMDLAETENPALGRVHERLFTVGCRSVKPIIVGVRGAALGGGFGLAAQGHVVVADPGAQFGLTEIRVGLWPLMIYRAVEAAIGPRRTLELSLTGRIAPAAEAERWGLVSNVGGEPRLIAKQIAESSPKAIEAGMQNLQLSRGKPLAEAGAIALELREKLMAAGDFREGVAAFREKRTPIWPSLAP